MATLRPEQIDDLVNTTLDQFQRNSWVDISLPLQFYVFAEQFMSGDVTRRSVRGGTQQTWKVQVRNNGNARFTGLFSKDQTSVENLSASASQPWSISTSSYSYDINEPEFQGDDLTRIVDEIVMRENGMYNDWFAMMETALWSAPISSTQDPRPLSGIPFWVQKNATEGFNGGDPSGFAAGAAGLLTTTYPRWKNYTARYGTVTRPDLISKWIKAVDFCQFRAPHKFPESNATTGPSWKFYATYTLREQLSQFLDSRNDNLKDLSGTTNPTFMSIPVQWVPELQSGDAADSTNPLYGINWNTMDFTFLSGREMVRKEPVQSPRQHNVRDIFMDSTNNLLCKNRRGNFVMYN